MDFNDGRHTTPSEFQMTEIQIGRGCLFISLKPELQQRTRGPNDSFEQRNKGKPATLKINFDEFEKWQRRSRAS